MRKHQIVGWIAIAFGCLIVGAIGLLGFLLTLNLMPQFRGVLG